MQRSRTRYKVGAADAFIKISGVIRTFFVDDLYGIASSGLSISVFFTAAGIVKFTRGVFAVAALSDPIIRFGTSD